MRKSRLFIVFVLSMLAMSCSKWDSELDTIKDRLDRLEERVEALNSSISDLQSVVAALEGGDYIVSIEELEDGSGYVIAFAKGGTITIRNGQDGQDGKDAPIIGVKQDTDGVYYWTITVEGQEEFLLVDGQKVPVSGKDGIDGEDGQDGKDGVTPVLGIDEEGYWTVDMKDGNGPQRILDANGNPVKAQGEDGGSIFKEVDNSADDYVIFVLSNGETITIPKKITELKFLDNVSEVIFDSKQTKKLSLSVKGIVRAEILSLPEGWTAVLDMESYSKSLSLTAPDVLSAEKFQSSGMVSLIGIDEVGNTIVTAQLVSVLPDFTDEQGTFIVIEGNMTTENGTIVYIDRNGNSYENIYENANGGEEIGNVVQDIYIHGGKIYIVTQNGSRMNGAGRFVVCDLRTMKKEYALELEFYQESVNGQSVLCWPQHLVVTDENTAYIQYSTSDMELYSGIRKMDLAARTISDTDIEGTGGAFTTEGATKARLVYSRGKVIAARGNSVVFIDAVSGVVTKTVPMDSDCTGEEQRQVKNVAKGADGNIYALVSARFTGIAYMPTWNGNPKVVCLDHEGNILWEDDLDGGFQFPVATYSPAVQMCASFNDPELFFITTDFFTADQAGSYNYETKELNPTVLSGVIDGIYGYMGIHPFTGQLFVGTAPAYLSTDIYIYDTTDPGAGYIKYSYKKASPAGVDFTYRFSEEWIGR